MLKKPVRKPSYPADSAFDQNLNHYKEVVTKDAYWSLIKTILLSDSVCIDYETQSNASGKYGNMEYWHSHSRTVSMSLTLTPSWETFVIPLSHPEGPWTGGDKTWDADAPWRKVVTNVVKAMVKNRSLKWVAHNAKYEVAWTYAMTGIAIEDQMWWDTQMSDYLLDENEAHSLKDKAVRDLGVERWDDVNLKDSESEPWHSLALYNARDTDYCLRLVPLDKKKLQEEPRLARLFNFLGMPILRTLARIERNGMPLDQNEVAERRVVAEATIEELDKKLMKIAVDELGMDPEEYPTVSFGTTNNFFKAFMDKAGFPIIKYTATGNPSWDKDALETLELQGHDLAKDIGDIRKASNKISKFFEPWTTKLGEDGRIHPSFNPMRVDDKWSDEVGTSTGRLSSSNPNAQQIAREEKSCFGAEDGWLFVELDYSQIELRILAWLGQIDNVLQAYEKGQDLHVLMAAKVAGVHPAKVTKDMRQSGKAGNFGFAYDMGERTYVEYARKNYRVDVTIEEARKIRKAFFNEQWIGLRKYHERQRTLVHRFGYVRNPIGRKRRLPEVYSGNQYEIGRAERRAINAPTQSMASDLMCLSLIEIDRAMDPTQVRLVGTVHDSLLAQFRAETLDENLEKVANIMLDPGTERKFGVTVGVPLEVEAKVGYRWNDPDGETRVYR